MKLVTQDGRKLELSRKLDLFVSGYLKGNDHNATVTVTMFTRPILREGRIFPDKEVVERYGTVAEYSTNTGRENAAKALKKAWEDGATEFIMPQDTGEKTLLERFEDFCDAHGLRLVSMNELGYSPRDIARNGYLWKTTDEFERRGILVAGEEFDNYAGYYIESLRKWQSLQAREAKTA